MAELTKIFFGQLKQDVASEEMDAVSFWGSERFFSMLPDPVRWEHGVLQVYETDPSHLWWTLTGMFQKSSRFEAIEDAIASFEPVPEWAEILRDVFTTIVLESSTAEDFESMENEGVYVFEDCESIDLSHMTDLQGKQVWVMEVSRYLNPPASLAGEELQLNYDNSDELDLQGRYMLCMIIDPTCSGDS